MWGGGARFGVGAGADPTSDNSAPQALPTVLAQAVHDLGMNTFVRVVEVWVPSNDGRLLELAGGLFDNAPAYGAISRHMCFGRGEALPGRAWDEGCPQLLPRLEGSYFRRTAAAQAAGLTCAAAVPIFIGERLTSVVVLLCGDEPTQVGAVELWHNDPRVTSDLKLADGYFGATDPTVEALTRDGSVPRGAGAPGLAWQRESAVFIDNVGDSSQFLRSQVAARAGILRALAIPCTSQDRKSWVLSLLSSSGTPIARRFESWIVHDGARGAGSGGGLGAEPHLQRGFGFCEVQGRLTLNGASSMPLAAPGAVAEVARTGVAQAASGAAALAAMSEADARATGVRSVLAIPVISDAAVTEVVALYF